MEQLDEEKIILLNIPLIYKTIKDLHLKYKNEDEFKEYYDAGIDGLIKGIRSYDETKGKISTWCIPCIKNEILHLLTQKNYKKNKNEFGPDISLYSTISENQDFEIIDMLEDSKVNIEFEIERKFESEKLLNAVNQLANKKDQLAIKMYYGLDGYYSRTYQSIAEYMNCTKSCVQFRVKRGLKILKEYLEKNDYDLFALEMSKSNKSKGMIKLKESKSNLVSNENNLNKLNNILFDQLEKLNDNSMSNELFEKEIKKSYATAQLAQQIIANMNTGIKAMKLAKEYKIENNNQLAFIGLKND